MRAALLAGVVLLCLVSPAVAEEAALSPEESAWLKALAAAGWSEPVGDDDVSVCARDFALNSAQLPGVLAKQAALSEDQRATLNELIRIEVKQAGWLDRIVVDPGVYTFGLQQGLRNVQLVARDATGNILDVRGARLREASDAKPAARIEPDGGGVVLRLSWGQARFRWFFVTRKAHTEALGAMTERKAGNVSVFSDLPDEAGVPQVAALLEKAVKANEPLTGGRLPEGFHYVLYLHGQYDTYKAIDQLLTAGNFAQNGAFTSWSTGRSYVVWYTHHDGPYALPSSLLQVMIHELHHQFMYAAFPSSRYEPDWWQESLAEVAAQQGLELADKQAAENYRKRRLTELDFFGRAGRLPHPEDLLAGKDGANLSANYTAMWVIGRALAAQSDDLRAMVAMAAEYDLGRDAGVALQRELDKRYPSIARMFETARRTAARDGEWYVKWNACVDERDGAVEVNTEVGLGGFALLNQPVQGNSVSMSGDFRWDDQPLPQVDFVFAYGLGPQSERFLKLALLPGKAVLFEFRDAEWSTLGTVEYETPLAISQDGKPLWHSFSFSYDAESGKVRLDTTNGRWAEFKLADYNPCKETCAGIGTYNGVVWFRNLKVK
ncbi:MAG: hypothetical protein H6840_09735 [Planctomycetes bacterium]|nr:hypothetical protein [Planctomycetota bacterium]